MGLYTQQDPIGIAGGLNLYGYAGGDPINFSDPFGLRPCDPPDDPECEEGIILTLAVDAAVAGKKGVGLDRRPTAVPGPGGQVNAGVAINLNTGARKAFLAAGEVLGAGRSVSMSATLERGTLGDVHHGPLHARQHHPAPGRPPKDARDAPTSRPPGSARAARVTARWRNFVTSLRRTSAAAFRGRVRIRRVLWQRARSSGLPGARCPERSAGHGTTTRR
jgi:uncharacterized protein RhaS with RHS repeats